MLKESLRDNPPEIADYLTEIFEKNDLSAIVTALKRVMQSQNVKALAESTGMRRDGLYKTFNGTRDPQLSRILKLLEGLNVQIVFRPLPAQQKPPRPKLGRPLSRSKPPRESSA
jgi:probable addiction module antidote protein